VLLKSKVTYLIVSLPEVLSGVLHQNRLVAGEDHLAAREENRHIFRNVFGDAGGHRDQALGVDGCDANGFHLLSLFIKSSNRSIPEK